MAPRLSSTSLLVRSLNSVSAVVAAYGASSPTASVLNGTYSGTHLGDGLDVNQYLGMPYANAPRFARPTPLNASWTGTRNAIAFGYSCVQVNVFGVDPKTQGEDCLNLNVWQPAGTESGAELPVLLWIYGGGECHAFDRTTP